MREVPEFEILAEYDVASKSVMMKFMDNKFDAMEVVHILTIP